MRHNRFALVFALVVAGSRVTAQGSCPLIVMDGVVQQPTMGPGELFGVTAYQCTSCTFKRERDAAPEYGFSAEPLVLGVMPTSVLRVGDVVEAVNGQPITTRAGADQFTYPRPGESVIAVRRAGARLELRVSPRAECWNERLLDRDRIDRVEVLRGAAAERLYGPAAAGGVVHIFRKPPAPQVRTVRPAPNVERLPDDTKEPPTAGRYGFAISCLPSCTRARASDGAEFWKFDGYPPVAGIRAGGAAALAGLQVGDVVIEIDGISILTEEGALRFQRAEQMESLRLTVRRDGRQLSYLLKAR